MNDYIDGVAVEDSDVSPSSTAHESGGALAIRSEMSVTDLVAQVQLIQQAMQAVMKDGEHYGVIPGTGSKPSLFKPGAEKLLVLFRLAPSYDVEKVWHPDGHLTAMSVCTLTHMPTSQVVGSAEGLCTTKESRYAYRNMEKVCPSCGKPAIIKGKQEYGGGWVCFKRKDGCGAKFNDGDKGIEEQPQGKMANPDLADSYNTVIKMAQKRSLVAAVLNATAASDFFTQDVEDLSQASAAVSPNTAPAEERDAENLSGQLQTLLNELVGTPGWSVTEVLGHVSSIEGRTFKALHELPVAALRQIVPAAQNIINARAAKEQGA